MARKFSLESILTLTDKWTKPLANAGRKYTGFTKKLQTQFNGVNRSVEKFNKNIRSRSVQAGKAALVGLGGGVLLATKQYIEFDDALVSAGAKFKDMNLSTEQGQKTLEKLRQKARETGAATQFSAVQAALGLEKLAMAGFTSEQAMGSLGTMLDLATASNTDFSRATDISSDLLGAFNLTSKDAAVQQKNLIRLNDVLAKTAASANVDLEDMFETMKIAAPIASSLNVPLEQVAAITGVLGNSGIKGSMGATALKNILLTLSGVTPAATKKLKKLGVETKDLEGNLRSPVDILKDLKGKLDDIPGTANKAAILGKIFGKIPVASITKLVGSLGELGEMEELLNNSGGAAAKMAGIMRESLGNQLKIVGSAATELGFKFVSAFDKDGRGGLKKMAKAISEFDVKPIVSAVRTLFSIFAFGFKIIRPFIPLIIALTIALQAYEFVMKISIATQKLWTIWTGRQIVMTKLMAAAQWVLNAAMTANPIALVVLAVVALVAVGVILVKNWDMITAAISTAWDKLKAFAAGSSFIATTLRKIFLPIMLLIQGIMKVGSFVSSKFGGKATLNQIQKTENKTIQSQPVRSPVSNSSSTTVNRSEVGINVNAPQGTTVEQKGTPAPGTTLALGAN